MNPEVLRLLRLASVVLADKKAYDVITLDVTAQTSIADAFVMCSVGSSRQAQAVSDEVERVLKESGERPLAIEGYASGGWVLMDYGDFVLHIFLEERREYYGLERLWGDAPDITAAVRSGD